MDLKETRQRNNASLELKKLENEILSKLIVKARTHFYTYVKLMAPVVLPEEFIDGRHIEIICNELQDVAESVEDKSRIPRRLQIMLPPGSMKSKIASNLFPSWCLGKNPMWCFLAIGSDFEFAVDNFGRPTKDLIDSERYRAIFPGTHLKKDVQSAGRWDTTRKGRFVARGAGQNIAGRRAHISIVDDAITEQTSDAGRKDINSWYRKGLRTRLLPRGAEIIINTRWFIEDLSGFMIKIDAKSPRPWDVISIPALLTKEASDMLREGLDITDTRYAEGTSFWPEFWPTEKLEEIKGTTPPSEWAALYMQTPTSEEGAIVKRKDFRIWEQSEPPKCKYLIITMDTAFGVGQYADNSAYAVWGVFTNIEKSFDNVEIALDCLILLSSGKGQWEFSELCERTQELNVRYSPDWVIVENKASGISLIPELQKRSLPVIPYMPERDKHFRLHACTPYFQAGRVFVPKGKQWAEDLIEEVITFNPRLKSQRDDLVDCTTMAVLWMRDQFKIDNDGYSNQWDEDVTYQRRTTYWSSLMNNKTL